MLRCITLAVLLLAAARGGTTMGARAHLGRASELMRAEQYPEAARELEAALKQDPGLTEAQLDLGICRFQLRDYESARPLFTALAGPGKDGRMATYYLGRMDLTDDHVDSAIARFRSLAQGGEVRDEKYYLAVALFRKEQYAGAASLLREWIAEDPRDFRAHQRLARTLLKLGRPQEAAAEFARTRELHAYYSEGSVALQACEDLLRAGRNDDARTRCRPLADTDDVDKLVALGIAFGQAGDAPQARNIWEKAASLDPDFPEINYNLALACFQARDMRCGRTYAANSIRLWPDFPEANVLYGTILYMLREDSEAAKVLQHAQELRPDDVMVQRLLSQLRSR